MAERSDDIKQVLFGCLDFEKILADKGFKEAGVRAVIIDPMLKEMGYTHETIQREKTLKSPFLRTGSAKRKLSLIPDYALKVGGSYAWVLDAKAPEQNIIHDDNVEQVYCRAARPERRSGYFALCNGLEFACFRTTDAEKPALYFRLKEINKYWGEVLRLLAPSSFQPAAKPSVYISPDDREALFDYSKRPLLEEIPAKKREAKRHFGVHAYFTRQSWNVVAEYIKNFSHEGGLVLDRPVRRKRRYCH
jgi:hypothetical protein